MKTTDKIIAGFLAIIFIFILFILNYWHGKSEGRAEVRIEAVQRGYGSFTPNEEDPKLPKFKWK